MSGVSGSMNALTTAAEATTPKQQGVFKTNHQIFITSLFLYDNFSISAKRKKLCLKVLVLKVFNAQTENVHKKGWMKTPKDKTTIWQRVEC